MRTEKENSDQINAIVGTLQHQVLNNLDALVSQSNGNGNGAKKIDLEALDLLVKKPIMQSVGKLRGLRLALLNPGLSGPANGKP